MSKGLCKTLASAGMLLSPVANAGDVVLFDQIGDEPFIATALSSSQFQPGSPEGAVTTVDNFTLDPGGFAGTPLRITRIEATVAALQDVNGFGLIDSWTIQIYSSLDASTQSLEGDLYSASFGFPDNLTDGFSSFFGKPVELATFDVDVVLDPGEYWITVAMGNDSNLNGIVGIAGSSIGDGPAYFSGPGLGDFTALGNPAGYRLIGAPVPGPGGTFVIGWAIAVCCRPRRRGRFA